MTSTAVDTYIYASENWIKRYDLCHACSPRLPLVFIVFLLCRVCTTTCLSSHARWNQYELLVPRPFSLTKYQNEWQIERIGWQHMTVSRQYQYVDLKFKSLIFLEKKSNQKRTTSKRGVNNRKGQMISKKTCKESMNIGMTNSLEYIKQHRKNSKRNKKTSQPVLLYTYSLKKRWQQNYKSKKRITFERHMTPWY